MQFTVITIGTLLLCGSQWAQAGAACVVAKRLGDSLAIEWVAAPDQGAESALRQAERKLIERGFQGKYQGLHPQASKPLSHGYGAVIKTEYETRIGRQRTSYGCGFSASSAAQARTLAIDNLRNYSWGWKPKFGYRIVEEFRF
jgi:hypothetical protein